MRLLCPICKHPARTVGRAIAASDRHATHHGVVGLCRTCALASARLSLPARSRRLERAVSIALEKPRRYLCCLFADRGAANLATGLLGHPQYASEMLNIMGWE